MKGSIDSSTGSKMRGSIESSTGSRIIRDERDIFVMWTNKSSMSNFAALVNLMKAAIGVGFMRLPQHISLSGGTLLPSFVILVSILFSLLATHVVIRTQHKVARDSGQNYICFPNVIKLILDKGPNWCKRLSIYIKNGTVVFIILFHVMICAIYVNFMSYKSMFLLRKKNTYREIVEVSLIAPLVIICFTVWKIKHVTYISVLGDMLLIISLILIIYLIITDEDESHVSCKDYTAVNVLELPALMGTCFFAAHNFGVFLIVHAHMKKPKDFLKPAGVLNQSYMILFIFMVIAVLQSCFKLASAADLPLISDGVEKVWRTALRVLNSVIIFLSIPIHFQVCAEFTEHYFYYRLPEGHPVRLINCIVRGFYIVTIVILALFMPELAGFYPVFGDIFASVGGVFLPALIEFLYAWRNDERNLLHFTTLATDIILMIVGALYFALGVLEIIETVHLDASIKEEFAKTLLKF